MDRNQDSISAPVPVEVGDEFDVEIIGTGSKGDGIAKIRTANVPNPNVGYTLIIKDAQKGFSYRVRIRERYQSFAIADIV